MKAIHSHVGAFILTALSLSGAATAQVNDPSTSIVDARGRGALPPGVPRLEEVENSPGQEAWLRGMDAVVARDWQLALAWFQTALQRDPTNQALGRAVDLVQWRWHWHKANETRPPDRAPALDSALAAEVARIEAELEKRDRDGHTFDLFEAPIQGDPVALAIVRERVRKRVEQADLALADDYAREAVQHIQADDLAGAIELLRSAELLAPRVPNFGKTRQWLETEVAVRSARAGGAALASKAAQGAAVQVAARELELKRAEAAVAQAERAYALAVEYQDTAAAQVARRAMSRGAEAVAAARDRLATARATEARLRALDQELTGDAAGQK